MLVGASIALTSPPPLLRLQDPALLESSGLAVSARHADVLWTHADGGSVAEVRAVDATGGTVATVTLAGVDPYDPEALAPGRDEAGRAVLFLGDLGDNSVRRPDVSVFRFAEPARLRDAVVPARWFRFTYPDGPHDAEALLVHPRTGQLFVATKEAVGGGLYRAPADLLPESEGTNRLTRVSDVPPLVTDGAYLPDGRFVLRTYNAVHLYDRDGKRAVVADLPLQPQGESLAVTADGNTLLVGSEGESSAVYAVPVPAFPNRADGSPSSDPSEGSGATGDDASADGAAGNSDGTGESVGTRDSALWTAYRVVRVVAIVVLLGGIVAYLRRSRRR